MPVIKLSDIQEAADKKFGDFEVHISETEVVSFRPALRLVREKRRALAKALDIRSRAEVDNDDDLFDVYKDAFRISERAPGMFDKLAAALGDDPALWQELFVAFHEDTQAGEASASGS